MSDLTPHMDAGAERLLEESLERRQRGLDARERVGIAVVAGAFLAVPLIAVVARAGTYLANERSASPEALPAGSGGGRIPPIEEGGV